jgi:hypothetical protein
MKITIDRDKLAESPALFLRHAGYAYIRDRRTGRDSFVRRLTRDHYPRFHLYIDDEGEKTVFNLHLDQKQPIYAGVSAHSGEYEGEAVEAEIERLKQEIRRAISN